jgi:hypothetical protein
VDIIAERLSKVSLNNKTKHKNSNTLSVTFSGKEMLYKKCSQILILFVNGI